ncbi:hypothetical protein Gogos_005616, partial [Gossypium gossypioides]|nr:hypothetical protein [Gossypium gossypioides]
AINKRLPVRRVESKRWRPPESPLVKINYDGSFQSHTKRSCTRIVVRNSNGFVLGSSTTIYNNIPSVFATEALACFQAVEMGIGLGFLDAKIEGGALTVVKHNANKQDGSLISAYIMDSKSISTNYRICIFLHAQKQGNGVAHLLATECIRTGETTYLLEEVCNLPNPT